MTLVDTATGEVVIVSPDALTFSPENYGRPQVDQQLVAEYADALRDGADFPAIEVYADGEIAGGVHRWHAHKAVGLDIRVVVVECPPGISRRVFSVALNTRNGQRQPRAELQRVAVDEVRANPDVSVAQMAEALGVSPSTLHRWVQPITQAANAKRRLKAAIMLGAGMTQTAAAAELGVSKATMTNWSSELPKWEELNTPEVEDAVASLSDTARAAVAQTVDAWRKEATLVAGDKRDADRLRMAIGGWSQLRNFGTHKRREQVLALLSDNDRKTLAEMEEAIR